MAEVTLPDPIQGDALRSLHLSMRAEAGRFRLPFRSRSWRGRSGNWVGTGTGSSIDFQDHRPYMLGDDPRYIDWRAYARTGNYAMKLYREEVSPTVDLVLDLSASMFFEEEKARRSLELLYFCLETGLQNGSTVRTFLLGEGEATPCANEELLAYTSLQGRLGRGNSQPPRLSTIPWRTGSMRVFISDLLFPVEEPTSFFQPLGGERGIGVIFCPYTRTESDPGWGGNVEFVDCETSEVRRQRVNPSVLSRYQDAYNRHFDGLKTACMRHAISLAQMTTEGSFESALRAEAVPIGAVELWG